MNQKRSRSQFEPVIEDTVQCLFFFTSLAESNITCWEQRCSDINNTIKKLSENFIWHRDEFKLFLPLSDIEASGISLYLASSTCFGDNVEDEWFIVYIVLQLTKQYDDLIVQMTDNDGEFLLIEVANLLPSWANPENTTNRVFISNNHIHIIEPNVDLEMKLDLQDALKIVSMKQTYVSSDINQAIWSRIGNYPEKIQHNLHKAVVNLPVLIASLLSLRPALIAPIVYAYSNHDAIDAKACKDVSFENCVTVKVTFTKFLYAMLMHSKLLKCNSKYQYISNKDKKNIIGFKLTCGLKMIMNSSNDIFSTKEYSKFFCSLKDNGYFKENIEGSKEYTVLLEKAKSFFLNVECPVNLHVSNQISQLMSTNEYANEMEIIKMKNVSNVELSEDDEDWLSIQPDQLNDILNTNYGKEKKFKNDDVITPEVITTELTNFLRKSSDFEGIETNCEDENNCKNINFDASEFTNCLEKFMNLLVTKTDDSDFDSESSDIDEVGEVMIPFENNCENEMDLELKMKLNSNQEDDLCNSNLVSRNIIQSIKEEQASSGPSSNLLKAVGINKKYILDSDDDND